MSMKAHVLESVYQFIYNWRTSILARLFPKETSPKDVESETKKIFVLAVDRFLNGVVERIQCIKVCWIGGIKIHSLSENNRQYPSQNATVITRPRTTP